MSAPGSAAPDGRRPRRRLFTRALRLLIAAVVVVVLGAWFVLESETAADRLRRVVQARALATLGVELSIGHLEIDVLPPRVHARAVRATSAGQNAGSSFAADRILLRVSPWALIDRRIVVENLEIDRPVLNLAAGVTDRSQASSRAPLDLVFHRVRVRDGQVSAAGVSTAISGEIAGVTVQLDPERFGVLGASDQGVGRLRIGSGTIELRPGGPTAATLSPVVADISYGLDGTSLTIDRGTVTVGDSTVELRGALRGFSNGTVQIDADLSVPDLLGVWAPPGPADHAGRASFRGALELRGGEALLDGRLETLGARLAGLELDDLRTTVAIHRERVALTGLRARLYGGEIDARMEVDLARRPAGVDIRYEATGLDTLTLSGTSLFPGWSLIGTLDAAGTLSWSRPFQTTAAGSGTVAITLGESTATSKPRRQTARSVDSHAAERAHAAPALPLFASARVPYELAQGVLTLRDATLELPDTRAEIAGAIDLDGAVALRARIDTNDLRIVDHVVAQYRAFRGDDESARRLAIGGGAIAELEIGGTVQRPTVAGHLAGRGVSSADVVLGDVSADLETRDGTLLLSSVLLRRGAGTARGTASVRLPAAAYADSGPEYRVDLEMERFGLTLDALIGGSRRVFSAETNGRVRAQGDFGANTDGAFEIAAAPLTIDDRTVESLVARGEFVGNAVHVSRLDLEVWDGEVTGALSYRGDSGSIDADLRATRLGVEPLITAVSDAELSGWLDGSLRLRGTVQQPLGRLDVSIADLEWEGVELGAVRAFAEADGASVNARALASTAALPSLERLESSATSADLFSADGWAAAVTVDLAAARRTSLDFAAPAAFLLPALRSVGVGLAADVTGEGVVRIEGTGPLGSWPSWRAEARGAAVTLQRGQAAAAFDRLELTLDQGLVSGTVAARTGTLRIELDPAFNVESGSLGGRLSGALDLQALGLFSSTETSGTIQADLELTGTLDRPRARGQLVMDGVSVPGLLPWPASAIAGTVTLDEESARSDDLSGRLGRQPVSASARLPLAWLTGGDGTATLTATVADLPLAPWFERSSTVRLLMTGGSASLTLDLEASAIALEAWRGEITMERLDLRMRDYRLDAANVVVARLNNGRIELPDDARLRGGRTDIVIGGSVDVRSAAVDVSASGQLGFDPLNSLSPYWGAGGSADVDLRVTGIAPDLAYNGRATLRDGVISPPVLRQPIEDISTEILFEGRRVRVVDLTGELGGGRVVGSGEVFLLDSTPRSFRIAADVDNALLRLERDVRVRAGASLVFDGTPVGSLLSGTIDLAEGTYRRDLTAQTALLELLESPETEPDPFLQAITLDLRLRGDENLFIDNNLADVEVSADFDVRGTAAMPVMLGRSTLLGGLLFWNGNTFEVLQGTVEFNNPFETEATFEIRSRTEIRQYTIDLDFSGSLQRGVAFNYTSTPALSDLEMFNLLAFGEEPDSANLQDPQRYQQALGLQATRYLTDAYLSEVERGASRIFGVDRFRIAPTLTGQEADATARLTLGKRLNRNLYVIYSRLLSSSEDQLLTVEYRLSPRVRVRGTRDEDGSFGVDFLVQRRLR